MKRQMLIATIAASVLLLWAAKLGVPPVWHDVHGPALVSTAERGATGLFEVGVSGVLGESPLPVVSVSAMRERPVPQSEPPVWPVSSRLFALVGTTGTELVEQMVRQSQMGRRGQPGSPAEQVRRCVPMHMLPLPVESNYLVPNAG